MLEVRKVQQADWVSAKCNACGVEPTTHAVEFGTGNPCVTVVTLCTDCLNRLSFKARDAHEAAKAEAGRARVRAYRARRATGRRS